MRPECKQHPKGIIRVVDDEIGIATMTSDNAVWILGCLDGCEGLNLAWDHGGQAAPPGAFPAVQSRLSR